MFGRNFNRLFNELFNDLDRDIFNPNNFERKHYTSDDGSFSFTIYTSNTNGFNNPTKPSEISLLKQEPRAG